MAVALGYKGTITFTIGGTAYPIDFVGAWSAESKREVKKDKPRITATSTGTSVKSLGSKELTGSLSGQVDDLTGTGAVATLRANRRAVIDAHLNGALADIALVADKGLGVTCPGAIISGFKLDLDSEEGGKIELSFENGASDYTFPDTVIS